MENTSQEAIKISRISILVNLLLSAGKLAAGLFAHSGAMISDAVHSASDVFSTLVVIVGVKLSGKESDREHPYGHERMECVAAILLSGILLATGLRIAKIRDFPVADMIPAMLWVWPLSWAWSTWILPLL